MNHYILSIVLFKLVENQKIQKLINVIKSFTINPTAKQACKKNLVTIKSGYSNKNNFNRLVQKE